MNVPANPSTLRELKNKQSGFTIIEVLIVLAIAGLIMLIVFLAVPALQRNSRNNSRNNDASRIASAITECLANRNSQKVSCDASADLQVGTLNVLTVDSDGFSDNAATDLATGSTTTTVIGYQRTCNTNGDNDQAGSAREFAIMYQLETGINRCISG